MANQTLQGRNRRVENRGDKLQHATARAHGGGLGAEHQRDAHSVVTWSQGTQCTCIHRPFLYWREGGNDQSGGSLVGRPCTQMQPLDGFIHIPSQLHFIVLRAEGGREIRTTLLAFHAKTRRLPNDVVNTQHRARRITSGVSRPAPRNLHHTTGKCEAR